MSLNKAQCEAIAHEKGPCMVIAGPGSGKTTVITKRIEYLVKKYQVRPEEILVITFTKAAAREMKERFDALMQGEKGAVTFGTFHGIYYGILKWAYKFTAANILSEEEKTRLLTQVADQVECEIDVPIEEEEDFLQNLKEEMANIKNHRWNVETYEPKCCTKEVFTEIFTEYERRRKRLKKIDFEDMLVLCYELFVKRPDILKKWQERFRYILVDEFQDINPVQYDVIRMLASPEDNLFIVGDDDQSVYGFRGASPGIMKQFEKDYRECRTIVLEVNYRSTKAVVNGALKVICHNTERFLKKITTLNEQGDTVHIQEVRNPIEESLYILKTIEERKKAGIPSPQIAVLFRTNLEAMPFVETCMEYNIAFQMKEHIPNLYEHFIAEDLKAYMRMALGGRSRKDMLAVMNRPNRYIGRDSLEGAEVSFESLRRFYCDKEWMQDRIDQFEVDVRMMQHMAPYAAIQYIRKKIGYDTFLEEYAEFRKISLEDLKKRLAEIEERAKEYRTIEAWFEHMETYAVKLKAQAQNKLPNPDAIVLQTMHGAKGLEFDTVFILGANEGIMPYKKAKLPKEVEEERRLFYVAMTRAKKRLIISYTKEKNGKAVSPSRFVQELLAVKAPV